MSSADLISGRSLAIRRPPIAEINALAAAEAARGRRLIDLGQAVLGLGPPQRAVDRINEYLQETRVHLYAPDPGLPEVREAVAAFLRRVKGVPGARADQVMITCGANQAYVNALLTLTRPGDEVITFGPGYFDHDFAIQLAGCVNVEVELGRTDRGFCFDLDRLSRALTDRTRAVTLVSPGNPTGVVIDEPTLRALTDLCQARGLWLISDETYDLLTFPPAVHRSPASLGKGRVVVLGSFSKVFSLAAWRVGYLWGPAEFIEETIKTQDAVVVCAPVPSQRAALGALEQVHEYPTRACQTLIRRRNALLEGLAGCPALACTEPQGATFVFAQLTRAQDDVAFCRALVTGPGVVTVPGSAFGSLGAGWVRLSYGNQPEAKIREATARLCQFAGARG